jgi:tetratricopeptide (TPR) repeat protein
MRIIIFLLLISFSIKPAFSQTPSKKEMQEQMQSAMNELNEQIADTEKQLTEAKKNKADEATIKELEDQLAMLKKQVAMMGGLNRQVGKISDKTIQTVSEENIGSVPKRDITRINALPKQTMTDVELVLFVQKVSTAIDKKLLVSQKNNAQELYGEINMKSKSPDAAGNIAVLCWMCGSTDMALWILGKACMSDMSNTDNLNNYAGLLSMAGGEQLAIPILQNLEKKFPDNTTILNNLGQAWYGLGDMSNAKKYLNKTAALFPAHPLANETKSGIEKSEGQTQKSIESLQQSMEADFTTEKETELNEMGRVVKYEDVPFHYPAPAEPLGIEKFLQTIPEYNMSGGTVAEISRMEWEDYRNKLQAAQKILGEQIEVLKKKADDYEKRLLANPGLLKPYNNKVHKTAKRKLMLLMAEWGSERMVALAKKMMIAGDTIGKWRDEYQKSLPDDCAGRRAAADAFNAKANTLWHQRNSEWITFQKQFLGEQARLSLYAYTDRSEYELIIAVIKSHFLSYLAGLQCEFEVGCIKTEPEKPGGKILPDFDEMNCQYKTELAIPYFEKIFSIKVECNKMTTEFDVKYLKGSLEENLANGKYHGTVEVQGKIGSDKQKYGPIEIGTQIKAGAGVDFNEGGIQDVYVTGKVGVKAGPASISSLEAKMSVVTGTGSVTGKGAFSGISIK